MRGKVVAVVLLLMAASCSTSGLQFSQDERISFVTPGYREKVTLPLTVEWTVKDFNVTGPTSKTQEDAGYFAVLLDVDPLPVGETLSYYARDDRGCRPDSGCPDKSYLADRRIHTTTKTRLRIARLPTAPGIDLDNGDRDLHEVTILLLDGRGTRISESLWTQTFEVKTA
jgi:hypothetical protein